MRELAATLDWATESAANMAVVVGALTVIVAAFVAVAVLAYRRGEAAHTALSPPEETPQMREEPKALPSGQPEPSGPSGRHTTDAAAADTDDRQAGRRWADPAPPAAGRPTADPQHTPDGVAWDELLQLLRISGRVGEALPEPIAARLSELAYEAASDAEVTFRRAEADREAAPAAARRRRQAAMQVAEGDPARADELRASAHDREIREVAEAERNYEEAASRRARLWEAASAADAALQHARRRHAGLDGWALADPQSSDVADLTRSVAVAEKAALTAAENYHKAVAMRGALQSRLTELAASDSPAGQAAKRAAPAGPDTQPGSPQPLPTRAADADLHGARQDAPTPQPPPSAPAPPTIRPQADAPAGPAWAPDDDPDGLADLPAPPGPPSSDAGRGGQPTEPALPPAQPAAAEPAHPSSPWDRLAETLGGTPASDQLAYLPAPADPPSATTDSPAAGGFGRLPDPAPFQPQQAAAGMHDGPSHAPVGDGGPDGLADLPAPDDPPSATTDSPAAGGFGRLPDPAPFQPQQAADPPAAAPPADRGAPADLQGMPAPGAGGDSSPQEQPAPQPKAARPRDRIARKARELGLDEEPAADDTQPVPYVDPVDHTTFGLPEPLPPPETGETDGVAAGGR